MIRTVAQILDHERRNWGAERVALLAQASAAERREAECVRALLLAGYRPTGTYSIGQIAASLRLTTEEILALERAERCVLRDAVNEDRP